MRFSSIHVSRYGHFEERNFHFPRSDGAPDVHLVVGENEAGKTTLKQALVDFLFGVPPKSPYAFRYDKPAIVAELDVGGDRIRLERTAGRKGLTPRERAAPVAAALDGLNGASFLATQAFSHDEMRAHARLLQVSRGALKELIERDAGGLAAVPPLVDQLQKEADEHFKKHKGHRSNRFRVAEMAHDKALEEAARALDASRHRALLEARDDAEGRLSDLRQRQAEARALAERLERERRAERIAAKLAALQERLDALPDVRLAPDAAERVNEAILAEARARTALESATERRAGLEERRAAVPLDEAVMALAAEIDDLAKRQSELAHREREREARADEADAARSAALARARDVGLPAADLDALEAALPAAVDRRDADRHMRDRDRLQHAVEAARKEIEEADAEPPPEVPEGPGAALIEALDAVADLGHYRVAWQAASAEVQDACEALRRAEADAAGDEEAAAPPPPEEGEAAEREVEEARQAAKAAEERVETCAATVRERRAAARRARADEVPTADVLMAAREERDALWRAFAAGRPVADASADYERLVAQADRIADVRFDKNNEILAAERAREELLAAEEEHAQAVAACGARRRALEATRERWAGRLAAAGLSSVPADYRAWHARRHARGEAARVLSEARGVREALRERLAAAVAACAAALGEEADADLDDDVLLRAVDNAAAAARADKERLEAVVAEARAAAKAQAERARDQPRRERALKDAEEALAAWRDAWRPLAARCAVPEDVSPARLADVLDGYRDIEALIASVRECERALAVLDRLETALAEKAGRVAAALGEAPREDGHAEARAFVERLAAARRAAEEAARLDGELEAAGEEEARVEGALKQARRDVVADREAAGLPPDAPAADLADAARASDERHAAERSMAAAREELAAEGFAWPAARETLAAMTPAEREAAAEEARERVEGLAAEVEDAVSEKTRAYDELERAEADARGGAANAARARFEAGVHARAMAEAAAEAIRRRLEIAVLSAARDTFASENRSPILERASRIFAALTGGAYDRLEPGWASGQSFVRAHRVEDDIHVDVGGLSDGTRDQLVASVRVAAAEDSPLPFIADDLFVNADDTRAEHGFRVLAGLANGRQVIYLTHHAHLEGVARAAVGNGLSVIHI